MRRLALGASVVVGAQLLALLCACDGVTAHRGADEPLLVRQGQFIPGDIPGTPAPMPPDAGADAAPPPPPSGLAVTAVNLASQLVVPGGDKVISGRAGGMPSSVGVRFGDLGTGYWVVPIAEADPNFPGQMTFSFNADFNANVPAGNHPLVFTAIDGQAHAGVQFSTPLCVLGRVPDNYHECDPSSPVPAVVFELHWDADFDVDLHVITPSGIDINPKNRIGVSVDAGTRPPMTAPSIDRDSLGACIPDGLRQEDVSFPQYPEVGAYDIYADPFDSCGKPAARFTLTIWEAGDDGDLHATFTRAGELLSQQTTGGGTTGLFVVEKQFN